MSFLKLPYFVFVICLYINDVIGAEVRIKSIDEFINFKNNVNEGTTYEGTTVFLDSDIDFTKKTFEPIGNKTHYFNGTFDGQGYLISNIRMTSSSSQYVGLFGISEGLTIKNVILDSSCTIACSYSGSNSGYVGGFIGECYTSNRPCTIENSVNMGSVTFTGTISGTYCSLYLGGIAGYIYSPASGHELSVKNCANYGDVTHSGTSRWSYIGGIVGYSQFFSSSSKGVYIYDSLNHGTITHKGTTSGSLRLGGITGHTSFTTIENCVSAGKILSTSITAPEDNYIGSIVGYAGSDISIKYCYYTSSLSGYNKYGYATPDSESNISSYDSTTFQLSEAVSIGGYIGNSLVGALNAAADYYYLRDYSHWLLNKEKKDVSFTINGRTSSIKMNYQIILMPNLASEGKLWFDGWYEDSGLTKPLTSYEITSDTVFYGKSSENSNNYTISFDTKLEGVSVTPITAPFSSGITLPSGLSREHCVVAFWENKYGDNLDFNLPMPARDITLYAVWKCTRIKTFEDFIDFSKSVNNDVNYSGTTVFLDSDLDFVEKTFDPIGDYYNFFNGTFDGQGHVISNIKMNSSLQYVGLFGYSGGLTIRNVILDSSCSFTNSFIGYGYDDAYTGGIIGYCRGYYGDCTIENSVNMGSVTFTGNTSSKRLFLGGFAGDLVSNTKYESVVKNCANYGDVTHSGNSDRSFIGGIVGLSGDTSSKRAYIYNSLNYGTITHNGTTSRDLSLGGITGHTYYTTIENCVSAGKISSTPRTSPDENIIGSIAGDVGSGISINYCYFTSELGDYNKYGDTYKLTESNTLSYDSTTFELNGTVSAGTYTGNSLIGALNGYADYTLGNYSNWLLNKEKKTVSFIINGRKDPIRMSYQIILMPNPASEGINSFDGWYTNRGLTVPLTLHEVNESISLYGALFSSSIVVVSFDVNGGNALPEYELTKGMAYNSICGDLPEATRTGYTFAGWFTEAEGGEEIKSGDVVKIAEDQALYAHWTANTYTITFNTTTTDGDVLQQPSQTGTYDSEYGTLPEPERTGYTFAGWFTEEDGQGERITEDTNVSIAANHTLYAHWNINNYTIRFEYGNGADAEERVLDFNERIEYTEGLLREGYTFAGWDMKPDTVPAQDLTIRAQWTPNNYTLSFDGLGGEGVGNDKKNVTYDEFYGDLPDATRTGYTFAGWFTEEEGGEEVKSEDIVKITEDQTLYAHWSINQYTITFVFNNGSENEMRTLDYNEEIVYPENVEKTGYTFNGWDNKPERMPAENFTVTAQWISIEEPEKPSNPTKPSESVEIVFGKGLTEEEVKDILEDYTKEGFTITGFEWDEKSGETRVIVKFNDSKDAEEFVENVNKNGNSEHFFRNVGFVPVKGSFSSVLIPLSILYSLF